MYYSIDSNKELKVGDVYTHTLETEVPETSPNYSKTVDTYTVVCITERGNFVLFDHKTGKERFVRETQQFLFGIGSTEVDESDEMVNARCLCCGTLRSDMRKLPSGK